MEKITTADVIRLRQDVQSLLRRRILEAIEIVLEEEVAEALGVGRHERGELRQGYRNGSVERRVTTANGTQSIKVPRARVAQKGGSAKEFRSDHAVTPASLIGHVATPVLSSSTDTYQRHSPLGSGLATAFRLACSDDLPLRQWQPDPLEPR